MALRPVHSSYAEMRSPSNLRSSPFLARSSAATTRSPRAACKRRPPGSGKGTPTTKFDVGAKLGVLDLEVFEQAKRKLFAKAGTRLTDAEVMRAMAEAGTVAVLIPGATFFLMKDHYADLDALRSAGVPMALATDFNPGSCYTESMPMILTLAMLKLRMSIEECIIAATANGAAALGRGESVGSLEVGKQADLILLDVPSYRHLGYHFGVTPVRKVVKNGRVVV